MTRRETLTLLGFLGTGAACGPRIAAPLEPAPSPSLALDPLIDLVPAASLEWLIEVRAEELLAHRALAETVALVLPDSRFAAFADRHGGLDLRRVAQLVVAGYPGATLALASGPVQPVRIEAAFAARALQVEGRAIDGRVTRLWGSVGAEREQVAIFDGKAVGLERGHFGPLRTAIYFAQSRLKRARPALRAEPLASIAKLLGEAPVRAFIPGPFEDASGRGLGGLLRATTAVALSARLIEARSSRRLEEAAESALEVNVVLSGAWGGDATRAAERLGAAYQLLAADALGRLTGIDHPLEEPRVSGNDEALRLEVTFDAVALARGLRAATDARISEIMAY
jgi:hypothetical protein